jgi:hypothetical protein
VIFVARPHIVHVVIYLLAMGTTGMKKSEKNVLMRVTVWAAGIWQSPHTAKIRTSRYALRFIPKMIGITPPLRVRLEAHDSSLFVPRPRPRVASNMGAS